MNYGSDVSPRTTKASLCTVISETGKDISTLCDNTEISSHSSSGLLLESNERVSSAVCVIESKDDISSVTEREYNLSDPVDPENNTEMTKMAFEATHRPDHAHSASAAATEYKLNTSQGKLSKLQRKDADEPDTALMDVKKEKDSESVGSPGTPLLDEQPYSPSLNVPDTRRKDMSKKGETETKNEFDDSVQAATDVVTQSPHPLSETAVTCSSISNHPTPPLVTKDDIHSEMQDIIDCKKTSGTTCSGIINSSPLTVPDCSTETGIAKCEPSENKVQESGDNFLCSGSGINSQNTDFVVTSQTTEFSSQRTMALHPVVKDCTPSSLDIGTVAALEDEKVGTALSSTEFTNDKRNLNDADSLKQTNCEMKCKDAENCKDTESSSKNVHRRHSSSSNSSSSRRRRSESGHRSSKVKSDHREKLETNSADSSSRDRRNSDTKEACRKERSHSSSSSDRKRHCSRCYKRSKIKRASIGVQCRRDKSIDKYVKHGYPDSSSRGGVVLKIDYQTKHFSLPRPLPYTQPCLEQLKYGRFIRIETYANGGATVVHMYQDEIDCLNKEEMEELVQEYFKVCVQYTAYLFCNCSA